MCESAAPRLGLNCRLLPVGGCVHSRRRAEGTRGKNHDGGAAVAISKPNLRTLLRAMGRSAVIKMDATSAAIMSTQLSLVQCTLDIIDRPTKFSLIIPVGFHDSNRMV